MAPGRRINKKDKKNFSIIPISNTFTLVKQEFNKKRGCGHVAGRVHTRNGLRLPCCWGTSQHCRRTAFNMMANKIFDLSKEIDQLKGIPTKEKQKEFVFNEWKTPNIVNNFNGPVTICVQQNNYIGLSNISISKIMEKGIDSGLSRLDIYNEIFKHIKNAPKCKTNDEIIKLVNSKDASNSIMAQIEIHNAIVDSTYSTDNNINNVEKLEKFIDEDKKILEDLCNKNNVEVTEVTNSEKQSK